MDAIAQMSDWIVRAMDVPLGWLLALPRDVTIFVVAAGTSVILTLARKWTTNQDQMRRCRNDLRRLKQLRREAKRAGDLPAVKRLRATVTMINGIRMKAEGIPLLVSILPIILLALWAVARLDYLPPKVGDELTVRAYYPLSSGGKLTHLVVPNGVELCGDAIQLVKVPEGQKNGLASWKLRPTEPCDSIELVICHQGERVQHEVWVGVGAYAPPVVKHSGGKILATEMALKRAKFLGIVPGIALIGLPPWLMAYLIIVIPLVPILRRVLRVY